MEDTQHHETFAVKAITKDVFCIQYFKHEFAVVRASFDRAADKRMFREDTSLAHDLRGNDLCKARMAVMEKGGKAVATNATGDATADKSKKKPQRAATSAKPAPARAQ